MENLTSLYFPETIAQYPGFRQLLLFADSIIQYLPAEDSYTRDAPLVAADLLVQYVPLPFEDELPKFQRLIKDIQGHGNEFYGNYLASLSSSADVDVDEASVWRLINQMNSKGTNNLDNDPGLDSQDETFLQARLLLKLAEIHERDERELLGKMATITSQKEKLLAVLKGDVNEQDLFNSLDQDPVLEKPARVKQRLKAWAYLYLNSKRADTWFATAGTSDILEMLENSGVNVAVRLFDISLGELTYEEIDDNTYFSARQNFQKTTKPHREILHNYLQKAARTGSIKLDNAMLETIKSWNEAVAKFSKPNFANLEFYLFRTPMANLFAQACNVQVKNYTKKPIMPNTIVGILT